MLNIEAIEVVRAIVHKIDYYKETVEFAPDIAMPAEGMAKYFEEHIRNIINSATVKTGNFVSPEGTVCTCVSSMLTDRTSFYEQSKIMSYWFYNNYEHLNQNTVFLAFVEFADLETAKPYIAVIKLDPVRSFRFLEDKVSFEQIYTLPDTSKTVNRGAIIGLYSVDTKYDFIFRNQSQGRGEEPEVGKQWIEGFLEGNTVPTPKQLTQLVVKETEKWINSNQDRLEPEEPELLRDTINSLAQTDEMDVLEAANLALKEDQMKVQYVDGLISKGLQNTTFTPDKEWAEKHSKKTTYVCDYNVTISGNTEALKEILSVDKSDPSAVNISIETKKFTKK
ncbi:MAG: nucleoid-associated protein [Bacillota bacterium]|nr:nucleoid-associated protein [Bacillota bacterium]